MQMTIRCPEFDTLEPGPSWKRNAAFLVECGLIEFPPCRKAFARRLVWQPQTRLLEDQFSTCEVRPRFSTTGSAKKVVPFLTTQSHHVRYISENVCVCAEQLSQWPREHFS